MEHVTVSNNWLSLSEYSSEHGISVSTLRRRIKTNQVKYKMINGKYYLDSRDNSSEGKVSSSVPRKETAPKQTVTQPTTPQTFAPSGSEENTFQTAKVLLDELKKAYMQSLQDKEKQIIQLKQQIADLKTLVMYLERENEKTNSATRY